MIKKYQRPLVFIGTRLDMEPLIHIAELNNIPILGILDRFYVGQKYEGLDVIGSDLDLLDADNKAIMQLKEQADFFVSSFFSGYTEVKNLNENTFYLRLERIQIAKTAGCNLINLIHPNASVSPTAKFGRNTLIMEYAFIESHCNIGSFCTFMYHNCIAHHSTVGENCAFMPGITGCSGFTTFGNNVTMGVEAQILSTSSGRTSIGNNVIVSPRVLVLRDIPDDSIVQINGKIISNTKYNAKTYMDYVGSVVSSYKKISS